MLLSKDGNIPSMFISCQKISYCIVNNKYFHWDMMLCHWEIGSQNPERTECFHLQGSSDTRRHLDLYTLADECIMFLWKSGVFDHTTVKTWRLRYFGRNSIKKKITFQSHHRDLGLECTHWICFFDVCSHTEMLILAFFCNPSPYPAASVSYEKKF
jgi:hypothetical protein